MEEEPQETVVVVPARLDVYAAVTVEDALIVKEPD